MFGLQCDRTGPTANVGTVLCPGYQDYIALVNSKGGVEGYKIKVLEIDNEYKVPPAIEAHERFKKEGAVLEGLYGTPQTAALNKKLEEDKILGTSPGFGTASAADGKRYPYTFPIAASYWSQAGAAVAFAKEKLGGNLKGKKIAYIYYDNPAGKEPLAILEDLAKAEGFEMRTFAVPAPGLEMGAQILDITGRFKPDFIISHLFGRAPSVSIKELKGKGFPLSKVVGLRLGQLRSRHHRGRRHGRGRRLQHHPVRRRRQGLPGDQGHRGHVQGAGQAAAQGNGLDGALQPRRPDRGAACRGRCATPSRPRAAPRRPRRRSRRAWSRSRASPWAASCRRWRSRRPTMRAAAGSRSGRSRAASSCKTKDWFQGYRPVIQKHLAAEASKS